MPVITPPVTRSLIQSAPRLTSSRTASTAPSAPRTRPPWGTLTSGRKGESKWPPVTVRTPPEVCIRGPATQPASMARLSATLAQPMAPTSRTAVNPASSISRAWCAPRRACSGTGVAMS